MSFFPWISSTFPGRWPWNTHRTAGCWRDTGCEGVAAAVRSSGVSDFRSGLWTHKSSYSGTIAVCCGSTIRCLLNCLLMFIDVYLMFIDVYWCFLMFIDIYCGSSSKSRIAIGHGPSWRSTWRLPNIEYQSDCFRCRTLEAGTLGHWKSIRLCPDPFSLCAAVLRSGMGTPWPSKNCQRKLQGLWCLWIDMILALTLMMLQTDPPVINVENGNL